MEIKEIDCKELTNLINLEINKNFEKDSNLFLIGLMAKENHFVAIENNKILGIGSYSEGYTLEKITFEGKEYLFDKEMLFLQFIEVIPNARNKGVGKSLAEYIFKICNEKKYGIQISNIVLDGMSLVNTYRNLSNEYKVDLCFYHGNKLAPQVFNISYGNQQSIFESIKNSLIEKISKFKR